MSLCNNNSIPLYTNVIKHCPSLHNFIQQTHLRLHILVRSLILGPQYEVDAHFIQHAFDTLHILHSTSILTFKAIIHEIRPIQILKMQKNKHVDCLLKSIIIFYIRSENSLFQLIFSLQLIIQITEVPNLLLLSKFIFCVHPNQARKYCASFFCNNCNFYNLQNMKLISDKNIDCIKHSLT